MNYWQLDEAWDYQGSVGTTFEASSPWYPDDAAADGPDIVLVVLDDVGFADLGCYGSEIETPHMDALAAAGHRYNNFHTTSLCSPSRASLLTGRNHHAVGMRMLANVETGWPSGRGRITRQAALVSEVLRDVGYNTFCAGKWHIAPLEDVNPGGPFDEWPLGRGFNRFYGFMNGATSHYYPELIADNHAIDPPARPEEGYHLTDDLVRASRDFIADHIAHRPDAPYFLFLPLGAAHSPHHAPREFMDRVKGRYDKGWDELRQSRYERQLASGVIPSGTILAQDNPTVVPWDSLDHDEQRVTARLQEAYAAFIEHTDAALGRLMQFIESTGRSSNTLTIVMSDNGASAEGGRLGTPSRVLNFNEIAATVDRLNAAFDTIGGPEADNAYGEGWAQAGNTPCSWYKTYTHGGGVRDPLIISWPGKLASPGRVLDQFVHVTDVAPTIYDALDIEVPRTFRGIRQMPIHGTSFADTFSDPEAPANKRRQYFEIFGHRGIWADGWKAVTRHIKGDHYDEAEWELYNLDSDFSESHDLADSEPERLRELIDTWWYEAGRYDVLPLDDRKWELFRRTWPRPGDENVRTRYDYHPPVSHFDRASAPPFEHGSYRIEAQASAPFDGVIIACGDSASGFVLYAQNGKLVYEYNAAVADPITTELDIPDVGSARLGFIFELGPDRTGRGRLFVDDQMGEWLHFPHVLEFLAMSGMDVGRDSLSPISKRYQGHFAFKGRLDRVWVTMEDIPAPIPRQLLD